MKNGTHIEFNIDNWFKGILDRFGLEIKLKKGVSNRFVWFSLDHSIEVNTGNNRVMIIFPLGNVAGAGSYLCQILDESLLLKNEKISVERKTSHQDLT